MPQGTAQQSSQPEACVTASQSFTSLSPSHLTQMPQNRSNALDCFISRPLSSVKKVFICPDVGWMDASATQMSWPIGHLQSAGKAPHLPPKWRFDPSEEARHSRIFNDTNQLIMRGSMSFAPAQSDRLCFPKMESSESREVEVIGAVPFKYFEMSSQIKPVILPSCRIYDGLIWSQKPRAVCT